MSARAVLLIIAALAALCAAQQGALLQVDQDGTVGVLLDEFPAPARAIVEDEWRKATEADWIALAKMQVLHTWYGHTWRMYLYDFEKLQLPLPDISQMQINITSEPYPYTLGDHEYIAVDYHFTHVTVTSQDSINATEPALVEVNGTYTETYTLPIDPMYIFQRTWYDCMDEAEFPVGSVDSVNEYGFFDTGAVAEEGPVTAYSYHATPYWRYPSGFPTQDCLTTLEEEVGYMDVDQVYVHIPWSDAIADKWRTGPNATAMPATPDLQPIAADLRTQRIKYSYGGPDPCAVVEGCIGAGWRRLLAFDGSTVNNGVTPMHIGYIGQLSGNPPPGVYVDANEFDAQQMVANNVYEYSSCHKHYHFQFYSKYNLAVGDYTDSIDSDHETVVSSKLAWCLESVNRIYNNEQTPLNSPYWLCAYQGVSTGWADQYVAGIPCQWIDITSAPLTKNGNLSFAINPQNFLCEGTLQRYANNSIVFEPTTYVTEEQKLPINRPNCTYTPGYELNNVQTVRTDFAAEGSFIAADCALPQHSPLRDCGWRQLIWNLTCGIGGQPTTFQIRGDTDLFVWRVCESSRKLRTGTWCSHMDALAWGFGSQEWSDVYNFTCPKFRDAHEFGRIFSVYVGPLSAPSSAAEWVESAEFLVNGVKLTAGPEIVAKSAKSSRSWVPAVIVCSIVLGLLFIAMMIGAFLFK